MKEVCITLVLLLIFIMFLKNNFITSLIFLEIENKIITASLTFTSKLINKKPAPYLYALRAKIKKEKCEYNEVEADLRKSISLSHNTTL